MTASRFEEAGLTVVAFPASWMRLAARPLSADRFTPLLVGDAMSDPATVAALDGPMFSNCDPGSTYATSDCADPRFAMLDYGGVAIQTPSDSDERRNGVTLSVLESGTTQWSSGGEPAPRARLAVQLYPTLVVNGTVAPVATDGSNGEVNWRAAVAELADGRIAFIVGRFTLPGFARALGPLGLRVRWAGYTDGGGSTALGWRDATGATRVTGPGGRPVAAFLIARPPAEMSAPEAVGSVLVPWLAVGGAAVLGVLAWQKRDDIRAAWESLRERTR